MSAKKIIILAKSAKANNFCIAGIEIATKKWIRPISNDLSIQEAVPINAARYKKGGEVQIFDLVEIQTLDEQIDNPIQPENCYYDENFRWKKFGETELEKVLNWRGFDERNEIFYNLERTITADEVRQQPSRESLLLLRVKNLVVRVSHKDDHKKFYANFEYKDKKYFNFGIGDISVRKNFEDKPEGEYFLQETAAAVFSLTNPYYQNDNCYKMIAQIFFI